MSDQIRALSSADAAAVESIIRVVQREPAFPIGLHWSSERTAEAFLHGFGWGVFDTTGHLQAFILLRDAVEAYEVDFLATAPDARGGGKMRKLLTHLLDQLPTDRALWLEVHEANNAARGLYQSLGFKEVGRRLRYYSDGGAAILYNYR